MFRRRITILIWLVAALSVVRPLLVYGQTTNATPPTNAMTFTPEIPIPGLLDKPLTIDGTTIAQYIRVMFIAFVWAVGVIATVMVIYGGIKWVAAAGNPSRINDARDIINSAIIGVIIALSSVVLLNIINPGLTSFKGIDIKEIKKIIFQTDVVIGENGEGTAGKACSTKKGAPIRLEVDCAVNAQMGWPVDNITGKKITSRIGLRDIKTGSSCHPGTDFSTAGMVNKPVLAVVDGVISKIESGCGEKIVTLETNEYHVRYVHIKSTTVAINQRVLKGAKIGLSGGDPKSSPAVARCSGGPHVHIELYSNNGEIHDIVPCIIDWVETSVPAGGRPEM